MVETGGFSRADSALMEASVEADVEIEVAFEAELEAEAAPAAEVEAGDPTAFSYTYILRNGELFAIIEDEDDQSHEVALRDMIAAEEQDQYDEALAALAQGDGQHEYRVRRPEHDSAEGEAYVVITMEMTADGQVTRSSELVREKPIIQDDGTDDEAAVENGWLTAELAPDVMPAVSIIQPIKPAAGPVSLLDWIAPTAEEGAVGMALAEITAAEPNRAEQEAAVPVGEAAAIPERPAVAPEIGPDDVIDETAPETAPAMVAAPAELEAGQIVMLRPTAEPPAAVERIAEALPTPEPPAPIDGGGTPGAKLESTTPAGAVEAPATLNSIARESQATARQEAPPEVAPEIAVSSTAATERASEQAAAQKSETAPAEALITAGGAETTAASNETATEANRESDEIDEAVATDEAAPMIAVAESRPAQAIATEPLAVTASAATMEQTGRPELVLDLDEPAVYSAPAPTKRQAAGTQPSLATSQPLTEPSQTMDRPAEPSRINPMETAGRFIAATPQVDLVDEADAELSFDFAADSSRRRNARRPIAASARRTA